MITLINNNEIKLKKYITTTIDVVCISINDIIKKFNSKENINCSILLIYINNIKILNILRHSTAHLMAHAIKNIYKKIFFATGPVIKNGFYYDFFLKKKINNNDLKKIENYMQLIVKNKLKIIRYNINIANAKKLFKNNKYKLEILNKINKKKVSLYKQGSFIDLCLGPHITNTSFIKNFKLLKVSGAYWQNNKNNDMLTRIYGTSWNKKESFKNFINLITNEKNVDHKKIGYTLNLFCFDEKSQGVTFWNKNGWTIHKNLINYLKKNVLKSNFIEVNTPIIINESLFEKSGHIAKFTDNMFKYEEKNTKDFLKPMNCPCHITIFNNFSKKSYKDLPYRIAEFGSCFRNEISGSLHGLMRLKNFTQDDGHIFCSEKQIYNEVIIFIKDLKKIYYNLGFKIFKVTLSKKPININDNITIWEKAENILEQIINKLNIKYTTSNDGAFYGPKLEFALKDKIDRYWQCGTIQLDFFSAKNLSATYTDKFGNLKNPIILHRALFGSIERFLGILLENNNGVIPFIINPIQFEIIYINNSCLKYAKKIYNVIIKKYNVKLNVINERLDYKIKKSILEKATYIIIIGENEIKNNTISIRKTISNNFIKIKINKFIRIIKIKKLENYY